jgi:signal peptidase I
MVYAFLVSFVMQVRYVDSSSMEPTIFGSERNGESVLVRLDKSAPERFDIVVLNSPDGGLIVKRVWGLPGEEIAIRNGDVFIEGKLLPPTADRPRPIPVFDDRWHELEQYFVVEDTVWSRDGVEWLVDAASVEPGSEAGTVFLHKKVQDSYLDRDHRVIEGTRTVNDLVASLEIQFLEFVHGTSFRIDLREWGDSFEALVEPRDETSARVTITRNNAEAETILVREDVSFEALGWTRLRFSNLDNVLQLSLLGPGGEQQLLEASYESNVFAPFDDRRTGKTFAHQVQFGAARARVKVRAVSLARDLFFTPRGQYAVGSRLDLGPEQLLVLGDNSARSRDGREFGPVVLDRLYGRATRVVWPFSSWRTLVGQNQP